MIKRRAAWMCLAVAALLCGGLLAPGAQATERLAEVPPVAPEAGLVVPPYLEALPAPFEPTDIVDPLELLNYRIHTSYRAPDGAMVDTDTDGRLLVPSLIDVDQDTSTGVGGFDVLTQLQIDLGRATLRVTQLPNAPDPLPLSVEASLADPRGDTDFRAHFGYDALAATAPEVYDATLAIAGAARVTSFSLDIRTTAPGETLGVMAGVYSEGPNGERLDPQSGRIDFTPVPGAAHFGVLQGQDFGIQQSSLDLVTDIPSKAVVQIRDIQGNDAFVVDATIDSIPNTLTLVLTDSGIGQLTYDYTAGDRVPLIDLRAADTRAGSIVEEFTLRLEDMAQKVTLVQDSATHATLTADSAIGALEAGAAEGGAVKRLPEPAYVYLDNTGGVDSLAFRILGLQRAELGTGDPFVVDATLKPGPMHVKVIDGAATIDAHIRDLPSSFRIQASPSAGTVNYRGSSRINEITVVAFDPAGISSRATKLNLLLRDLPTTLDLTFGDAGDRVSLDAGGQTLGLIEVQLTSGPDERLGAGVDGLLLRDRADRYVLFARITGLRRASAMQNPSPDLTLETAGGRILQIDLEELAGSRVIYTRARLDALPSTVRIRVIEGGAADRVEYTASSTANRLDIDTNTGNRWNLHVDISNPVPASFTICQASNSGCKPGVRGNDGSIAFRTSEPTTLNLFDCQAPANSSCPSSPSTYVQVQNLRIQDLEVANEQNGSDEGWFYLNTYGRNLSGFAQYHDGNLGVRATLPSGFSALNRQLHYKVDRFLGIPYDIDVDRSGSINCPPGTRFEVRVPVVGWLDITHEIRIFGIRFSSGIC